MDRDGVRMVAELDGGPGVEAALSGCVCQALIHRGHYSRRMRSQGVRLWTDGWVLYDTPAAGLAWMHGVDPRRGVADCYFGDREA